MNINNHYQFKENIYNWTLVRDCVAGESAVKRKSTTYLPMPSGMENVQTASSAITTNNVYSNISSPVRHYELYNPNIHFNPAYQAYLHRAHLPGMTDHTLRGLIGIATRKHPAVKLPESLQYLESNATPDGWTLLTLFRDLLSETLITGRVGLYLDIKDDKFVFCRYKTEDIINWQYDDKLTHVLLAEYEPEELFSDEYKENYTLITNDTPDSTTAVIHDVDENTSTEVLYQTDDDLISNPTYYGLRTTEIPFVFIGALDNSPDVDSSPLLPVAQTALQIYMKNADLSQAEYLTCNPTLILSGVTPDEAPVVTGSTVALAMADPQAKAYYTVTDSEGMAHLLHHIEKLSDEAAAHGASLIAVQKGEKESGDALKIRQAASTSTLHKAVDNVSDAITHLLKTAARWAGEDDSAVRFQPNTEFSEAGINSQQLAVLMESYLNGTLSLETLVDNTRRAGVLQSGDDTDDEIERIKNQQSNPTISNVNEQDEIR